MWNRRSVTPPNKNMRTCSAFFNWFAHDVRDWYADRANPSYWVFPIAFSLPFRNPLSCFVYRPGNDFAAHPGTVIGASHIGLFPAVAGAIIGSVLGDWISWWIGFSLSPQNRGLSRCSALEAEIEKGLQFFHRWGTWRSSSAAHGTIPRHVPLVADVRIGFLALHVAQHDVRGGLGLCSCWLPALPTTTLLT